MSETRKFTFFWRSTSPFSQWYMSDFKLDGRSYNCAEQYMMHRKATLFSDHKSAKAVMKAPAPREQEEIGRKVRKFDEAIWRQHREEIVLEATRAKFSQNPELKEALLATDGMIDDDLEFELLENAEVLNVVLRRDAVRQLILSTDGMEPISARLRFSWRGLGERWLLSTIAFRVSTRKFGCEHVAPCVRSQLPGSCGTKPLSSRP